MKSMAVLTILVVLLPLAVLAEEPEDGADSQGENASEGPGQPMMSFGLSPMGLDLGLLYKYQYEQRAGFQGGVSAGVSPSSTKLSAHIAWSCANAELRAQYTLHSFLGDEGALLSFDSPYERFDKDDVWHKKGEEEHALGHQFSFQPTLRAKLGRFFLSNKTDLSYFRIVDGDGPFFLIRGTLLSESDILVSNTSAVLLAVHEGEGGSSLMIGPAFEIVRAVDANLTHQRLSGQMLWAPFDRTEWYGGTRLFAFAGSNLQDPNRRGKLYLGLGLRINFSL